jgi:type VI secretion system protein ImpA
MSVLDLAKILEPVVGDKPCGTDLEYDAEFLAMGLAATPKPERQMGTTIVPAEEPDWRAVKAAAVKLCSRSKDLRVLVPLCRAVVHTDGLAGLAQGLAALRGVATAFWDGLYPLLDADDNNDPTSRVNVLVALAEGTGLVRIVREAPLVVARGAGTFGMREIDAAAGRGTMTGAPPTAELIRAAFQEVSVAELEATITAVRSARDELTGLEAVLNDKLGSAAPNLRPLAAVLDAQVRELEPHLSARGSAMGGSGAASSAAAGGAAAGGGAAGAAATGGANGAQLPPGVYSRDDVVLWLDRICDFYARSEPSSPLPILLQRAKRLVNKGFLDVVRDLVPDGLNQAMLYQGQEGSS